MYTTNSYASLGLVAAGAITTYCGWNNFCEARKQKTSTGNALLVTAIGVACIASGAYGIKACLQAFLERIGLEHLEREAAREAELLKRACKNLKDDAEFSKELIQLPIDPLRKQIPNIEEAKKAFTQANSVEDPSKDPSKIYDIFSNTQFSDLKSVKNLFQNPDYWAEQGNVKLKKQLSKKCHDVLNDLNMYDSDQIQERINSHVSYFTKEVDWQCRHGSIYFPGPGVCEKLKNQTHPLFEEVSSLADRAKDLMREVTLRLAELGEVCQSIN